MSLEFSETFHGVAPILNNYIRKFLQENETIYLSHRVFLRFHSDAWARGLLTRLLKLNQIIMLLEYN